MTNSIATIKECLPTKIRDFPWKAHPLDGKLLLFERNTGLNIMLEGEETRHLRRVAPRTLLIAVTNVCNLTCYYCYRDLKSPSMWRYDSLLEFCQQADRWGVLEVAFGGGEPMLFPRWQDFICELFETTNLCINFTTNGTLLTKDFLDGIAGRYGQIRISLHENNDWPEIIALLNQCKSRFGVNWLITPAELKTVEPKFLRLFSLGVRDFLFLSYKGNTSPEMHCTEGDYQHLTGFIKKLHAKLGSTIQIKLDICWGDYLLDVPRLFAPSDCEAGDDFLSITSDKLVKPCSFHHIALPFETIQDLQAIWQQRRKALQAAPIGGCARLPNRGLAKGETTQHANIHLATVQ